MITTTDNIEHLISEAIAGYAQKISYQRSFESIADKSSIRLVLDNKLLVSTLIRTGIPYHVFQTIQDVSPFNEHQWAVFLGVSTKTLARSKQTEGFVFKPLQSERIFAMTEFIYRGLQVFEDYEQFKQWLNSPVYALGNNKPVELLSDQYGRELVLAELIHIDHGIFV
ncbi:MAG: DUF2384 domain-containing protein [Bacteroidetes bacterium]|nr:DUF2384 domain-containing protein [Bacteroidota bacterium]MBU1579834.1 DUF2384 domain-containing protein [Bacteroidota bacterium]MBU2465254.1 DUF2384 domain-containing protein [Bacteroidota bacterium]MBU2558441.1 DUF2384 domain-containing protein [Bacteroidota bacterium]